jgi:cyanophycinase
MASNGHARGDLIIIGGAEEKSARGEILREVGRRAEGKVLCVLPIATREPRATVRDYRPIFEDLKVERVEVIDPRDRKEAEDEKLIALVKEAAVIFFPGGDQARITEVLGGTPLMKAIVTAFRSGTHVAGTSAGAAAMPETMVAKGEQESDSPKPESVELDEGMELLPDAIVDTHFAQRGRISRLLSAVGHHPKKLGLGIDEDTALLVRGDGDCEVLGSGAVFVVDGSHMTYSSVQQEAENEEDDVMSLFDMRMHVLARGDRLDWESRTPSRDGKRKDDRR